MSKPTIITSYSYTKGCEQYFKSFSENVKANMIVIAFDEFREEIHPKNNCKIYKYEKGYPGNTGRLLPILRILKRDDFDLSGWFIFTDTHDVVFQTDIPELNTINKSIIACPEDISFGKSDFWKLRVPKNMYNLQVFNVGSFAMRGFQLVKFLEQVQSEWNHVVDEYTSKSDDRFPQDTIIFRDRLGNQFNSFADTIIFNRFIDQNIDDVLVHPTLFTCLAHNLESRRTHQKKDDMYYNEEHEIFAIVHKNGSTKDEHE